MRRLCIVVLLGALGLGCEPPREEGLVVNLQSDFVPGVEFSSIEVSVDDANRQEPLVSSRDSFARPRAVATFAGLPPGNHLVSVVLRRGGAEVASRRVQVQLAGSFLVTVIVSRACGGVRCEPGETCAGGRCVLPSCVDGTEPTCPPPGCGVDADCRSSTACVVPSCVSSVCLETPRDERCAMGEVCVPDMGCVERPPDPDAGPIDAGTSGPCRSATDCTGGRMCCDDGVCRMSCVAGSCTGMPMGHVCRPAEGPCDRAETCDGSSPTCPVDVLHDSSTTCRASAGVCDRAERCSGTSASCPADAFEDGSTCRDSAGPCDEPERCDGRSAGCPGDEFDETGRRCRGPRGPCDEPEHCDGRGAQCPPDAVASAGAECRRAEGVCDLPEHCDGSSTDCPPDEFVRAGMECRGAGGDCGLAEVCPGDGPHCPPDAHRPSSFVCRWGGSSCDETETCPGDGADCPPDGYRANGDFCDERCGYEYCESGSCVGGVDCSGGMYCNGDSYCDYF